MKPIPGRSMADIRADRQALKAQRRQQREQRKQQRAARKAARTSKKDTGIITPKYGKVGPFGGYGDARGVKPMQGGAGRTPDVMLPLRVGTGSKPGFVTVPHYNEGGVVAKKYKGHTDYRKTGTTLYTKNNMKKK